MRAALYYETGTPNVFRHDDVPCPACPPNGVLIDLEAISIRGGGTLNRLGGPMTPTPHIVGYQGAGSIVEVGERVTDRSVGQGVVATMPSVSHADSRNDLGPEVTRNHTDQRSTGVAGTSRGNKSRSWRSDALSHYI